MTPINIPPPVFETRARGKLLLTAEYFVLDGSTALAIPVRYGQTFRVEAWKEPARLSWTSKNNDGVAWFQAEYELPGFVPITFTDKKTSGVLVSILKACRDQNPAFLSGTQSYKVLTQNDFPREWGLGTSSTLIAALARWAGADPYTVLFDTLGGSGYDIACAYAEGPILYRLEGKKPVVESVHFAPPFSEALWFVYLGQKQDSREGILRYREQAKSKGDLLAEISRLTERFLAARSLADLEHAILEHETLISQALHLTRAKDLYFSDFWGEVKSLGAWGGDFVLATSDRGEGETCSYFASKGMSTVLRWDEMVVF